MISNIRMESKMNRAGFMDQLQRLLADLPATEREEAIQYYNDYFDDAGAENEQSVIDSLGSPKAIADNIKAEISGEMIPTSAKAGDHAITKYGQIVPTGSKTAEDQGNATKSTDGQWAGRNGGNGGAGRNGGNGGAGGVGGNGGAGGYGGSRNAGSADGYDGSWNYGSSNTYDGYDYEKHKKNKMPTWALILIIIGLVIICPGVFGVLAGIFGMLIGAIAAWFGIIAAGVAGTFGVLVAALVVLCVSFLTISFSPIVFCAIIGIAMLCGSLGLFGLMITTWMIGTATPALFKGGVWLVKAIFQGIGKLWKFIFG